MKFVAVFVVTAALDAVWSYYIRANAQRESGKAATLAAVLILLGSFNTISIVGNPALVIPAAFGAFFGTLLAVEWNR